MADDQNPQNTGNPQGQQPQQGGPLPGSSGSSYPIPPPQGANPQGTYPMQPGMGQPMPQGGAATPGNTGMPSSGQPAAGTPGYDPYAPFPPGGYPPPPPPPPEDKTPANYQIGLHLPKVINVTIPAHSLQFDEQHFLHLLAGSISLTKDEKTRIIESVPKLRQEQVDELIRIFEEERRKFAELSAKHVDQLKKLEKQHWADWQDIELQQKAQEKKGADAAQADEIRKKLGL